MYFDRITNQTKNYHFLTLRGVDVDIEEFPESSLLILLCTLESPPPVNSMHDFGRALPETSFLLINVTRSMVL